MLDKALEFIRRKDEKDGPAWSECSNEIAEVMVQFYKKMTQNICTHENTKYVSDPSGNNDSYSYCLDCGIEKKRF